MTIETSGTIKLEDIVALEYECKDCHAKSVRLLDAKHRIPAGCSNCSKNWFADGSSEHVDMQTFLNVLTNFPKSSLNSHVTIKFEVKGLADRR